MLSLLPETFVSPSVLPLEYSFALEFTVFEWPTVKRTVLVAQDPFLKNPVFNLAIKWFVAKPRIQKFVVRYSRFVAFCAHRDELIAIALELNVAKLIAAWYWKKLGDKVAVFQATEPFSNYFAEQALILWIRNGCAGCAWLVKFGLRIVVKRRRNLHVETHQRFALGFVVDVVTFVESGLRKIEFS